MTPTNFFNYTPKTPYDNTPVPTAEVGSVIKQEDWSVNAQFEDAEYQTITSILEQVDMATEYKKPLSVAHYEEENGY